MGRGGLWGGRGAPARTEQAQPGPWPQWAARLRSASAAARWAARLHGRRAAAVGGAGGRGGPGGDEDCEECLTEVAGLLTAYKGKAREP